MIGLGDMVGEVWPRPSKTGDRLNNCNPIIEVVATGAWYGEKGKKVCATP